MAQPEKDQPEAKLGIELGGVFLPVGRTLSEKKILKKTKTDSIVTGRESDLSVSPNHEFFVLNSYSLEDESFTYAGDQGGNVRVTKDQSFRLFHQGKVIWEVKIPDEDKVEWAVLNVSDIGHVLLYGLEARNQFVEGEQPPEWIRFYNASGKKVYETHYGDLYDGHSSTTMAFVKMTADGKTAIFNQDISDSEGKKDKAFVVGMENGKRAYFDLDRWERVVFVSPDLGGALTSHREKTRWLSKSGKVKWEFDGDGSYLKFLKPICDDSIFVFEDGRLPDNLNSIKSLKFIDRRTGKLLKTLNVPVALKPTGNFQMEFTDISADGALAILREQIGGDGRWHFDEVKNLILDGDGNVVSEITGPTKGKWTWSKNEDELWFFRDSRNASFSEEFSQAVHVERRLLDRKSNGGASK